MATAAQVEQFRRSYDEIQRLVHRDMWRIWPQLRTEAPATIRNVLLELTPQLSDRYGAAAGSIAAEWFETVTGRSAALADLTDPIAVQASTRAGAGGLWTGQREAAFGQVAASTTRHSLQAGRSTIAWSAGRNGMRYARAPQAGACAWCLMLASRGPVYTAETVQFVTHGGAGGQSIGEKYHDDCSCVPEPAHSDEELSYDSRALYEQYSAVHERFMTDREAAAAMRAAYGLA